MKTIYKYVKPGETYGRIPARDLSEAEFEQALVGRSDAEKALIGTLYKRTRVAAPANTEPTTTRGGDAAQPADQAEEATNADANRI